jgi:exodeoxyribonuclease V alpha subunit
MRLLESHRMRAEDEHGKKILAVAQAIDQGIRPPIASDSAGDDTIIERLSVADITLRGVEFLPALEGPIVLDEFLDRWHRDLIRVDQETNDLIQRDYRLVDGGFTEVDQKSLRRAFEHWEQFRILCVTRVSQTTGANRVNAALHQRCLDERKVSSQRDGGLVPGEPVMMLINDYNRGIFNGDQGLVLSVIDHGRVELMAVFRRSDGFVAFHVDSLRSVLVHSYAMTVHKAQGSEFNSVAIVLPDRDLPINTREIIYTALTRSRQGAVIIGDREILDAGIRRTISRDSGIVAKLRGAAL